MLRAILSAILSTLNAVCSLLHCVRSGSSKLSHCTSSTVKRRSPTRPRHGNEYAYDVYVLPAAPIPRRCISLKPKYHGTGEYRKRASYRRKRHSCREKAVSLTHTHVEHRFQKSNGAKIKNDITAKGACRYEWGQNGKHRPRTYLIRGQYTQYSSAKRIPAGKTHPQYITRICTEKSGGACTKNV